METGNVFNPGESGKVLKKRNELVYQENERTEGIYRIKRGIVKIVKRFGRQQFFLWLAYEGEYIGIDSLFYDNQYVNTAVCLNTCELEFIEKDKAKNIITQNHQLLLDIMHAIARKSDELEERMADINENKIERNFVKIIKSLNDHNISNIIPEIFNTRDLANITGTTPNYLYKIITRLRKNNILLFKERKLNVVNTTLLNDYFNNLR